MNTGRIIGIILVVVAVGVCLLGTVLSVVTAGSVGGKVLGVTLAAILAVPLAAVGVYMLVSGRSEAAAMATAQQQKKLLGMVRSQGKVDIADAAIELRVSRDQIKTWVYDLVNKGLFTGYINWEEGDLISVDAAQMKTNKCPRCGGELELAGKGVVHCPYCGSEVFLS